MENIRLLLPKSNSVFEMSFIEMHVVIYRDYGSECNNLYGINVDAFDSNVMLTGI